MFKRRVNILPSLRVFSRRHKAPYRAQGEPPGTIVVEPGAEPPAIRGIGYGEAEITDQELAVSDARRFAEEWNVGWVNVEGLGDAEVISAIGEQFGLHPLALEDVAHAHERAKVEQYEDYLFVIARMAHQEGTNVHIEQFSMFVGDGWLVTFQEAGGDCFDGVRLRAEQGRGRIRRSEADYLAYALIDAITDAYFPILDEFAELLEGLERRIIAGDEENVLEGLHEARRSLAPIRRAVMPLRDVVRSLANDTENRISESTKVYLRDVDDHVSIISEQLESLRELSASLMDVHYTVMSTKMNEVMRVLTVIATIFMPLSFVAGMYGMNFDTESPYNMPELGWTYGYVYVWALFLAIVGGMIVFFRRRGWY